MRGWGHEWDRDALFEIHKESIKVGKTNIVEKTISGTRWRKFSPKYHE